VKRTVRDGEEGASWRAGGLFVAFMREQSSSNPGLDRSGAGPRPRPIREAVRRALFSAHEFDLSGSSRPAVDTLLEVRYAETDAQGSSTTATTSFWFEVGRTAYCPAAGYPYPRMEAEGIHIVVLRGPARYDRSAVWTPVTVRPGSDHQEPCLYVPLRGPPARRSLAVEGETTTSSSKPPRPPLPGPVRIREAFTAFIRS